MQKTAVPDERSSELDRAENVILAIVEDSGGELIGTLRLGYAFYLAHVYYARRTGRYLTRWPIIRLPEGPGIEGANVLLENLASKKLLYVSGGEHCKDDAPIRRTKGGGFELEESARDAVREAASFVAALSDADLKQCCLHGARSWKRAADGQAMDFFLDVPSDEEYALKVDRASRITEDVLKIFG